jgi:hypothetical protein
MPAAIGAIGGLVTAFKGTALFKFIGSKFIGRLLASVALSALQTALQPRPPTPGITTQITATGGTNPCGFVLGQYATAGDAVCPPMTHGTAGRTPNAYLTYVVALGDVPGPLLERVMIDGAYCDLGTVADPDYGLPATGLYAGFAWFKYYDGSQTVADPMLLAKYGSYPERPWLADMVGTGVPYVICTFLYNRGLYQSLPALLFQCGGIRLYDPRKDSTVGGVGAHRWGTAATYEASRNNAVIAYNIMRGITLTGLGVWGGSIEGADLPVANWFSAMNACDTMIGSPAVVQYQAGYEVRVDMEPASVIEEVMKGCTGQVAEVGGSFKIRVGGPGLPVLFITDDDIIVTKPQDYNPFPQADQRQNGIDAKYPDPGAAWQPKSAPSRYNTTWEAQDGSRRIASLDLPACPYPEQVQRVMNAYITDERRFRRHGLTLPPDAAVLEPLDTISWSSMRNGYASKLFELSELVDDLPTVLQRIGIRECDPADYNWSPAFALPVSVPSAASVTPPAQILDGWAVTPVSITDATGTARRAAIRMGWAAAGLAAVEAVQYQVRVKATAAMVKRGTVSEVDGGEIIVSDGIMAGVIYQARGLPVARGRAVGWTAWTDVTSPSVGLGDADFIGGAYSTLLTNQGLYAIRDVTVLPGAGSFVGEKVFNRSDGKLWQWTGSAWQLTVAGAASGSVDATSFAAGVRPVEILTALPAAGNFQGRMVLLTTDSKLYRHLGTPSGAAGFSVAVDGADITAASIVAGKIAVGAIGATEIAANAILASKVLISDTTNVFPDFDMEDADFYASSTVAAFFFTTTASQVLGRRFLSIPVSGALHSVESGWFAVEPSTEYLITASAWLSTATAGSGTSTVSVETGVLAANGTVTVSTSTQVATRTDSTSTPPLSVSVITGPTIRRMRFVLTRAAGGTATGRGAGYKVQKKATGSLVVDGTITGTLLAASGIITGTAQIGDALITGAKIGNLQVDTLQIANNAVTIPVYAFAAATITLTTTLADVATLSINRAGLATRVEFSTLVRGDGPDGYLSVIEFNLYRGATLLQTFSSVPMAFGGKFDTATYVFADTDTGTGATTYLVKAKQDAVYGCAVSKRFIGAQQFKK